MPGHVSLEILPWATRAFGSSTSKRLSLQEEIEEGDSVEKLFIRLASRYPSFGQIAFDREAHRLTGQITVIYNGRMLELEGGLATRIRDGDSFLLVPAFSGGAD